MIMGLDWALWAAKWTAIFGLSIAVALLASLYHYQSKLIYAANFPANSRTVVQTPSEHGMSDYQDVRISAADGVSITAYLIKASGGARSTLIYFHANAGNMGHRLPIAKQLQIYLGCNILMVSYRGYGLSEGEANEVGMKLDAQAALDYVLEKDSLKGQKIFIFGQSIGGAVAIHLTATNQGKVDGLIIENTFLSLVCSYVLHRNCLSHPY